MNLLPLSHVFGQFLGIFIPPLLGATVIFAETFSPAEIMHSAKKEKVSVLVGVPRVLRSLKEKIERYVTMWHEQYHGAWPVYPPKNSLDSTPSPRELWVDRLAYRSLSIWHHATPTIFGFVPSRFWEVYRSVKSRLRKPRVQNGSHLAMTARDSSRSL